MFNQKKKSLNGATPVIASGFVDAALKTQSTTRSTNGAFKYTTSGNDFVDQFSKLGTYKVPRKFADICNDCEKLWAIDNKLTIKFIVYIRMITRQVDLFHGGKTSSIQKGAELRHEGIMRMIWLHLKSPKDFWNNLPTFISAGSWKDIITMLSYDLQFNDWDNRKLDWNKFGDLILAGLRNENSCELLKKYLPAIKARSACKTVESQADTVIGKWICQLLHGSKNVNSPKTYAQYRRMKSSGTAHQWQQLISQSRFNEIDFSQVHGRALSLLVKSKFLFNQGLSEKYAAWVSKPEVKTVKYTGFVHELFEKFPTRFNNWNIVKNYYQSINTPQYEKDTINKQFQTLVEKLGNIQISYIVARDTSGSMKAKAMGSSLSCFDIAKALGLYFSETLRGHFKDTYIEFSREAILRKWTGQNPFDKWINDNENCVGTTDFLNVFELFARLKRNGLNENEFPTGLICLSDGEFNPAQSFNKTNIEDGKLILLNAGFSKSFVDNFVVVLWNLQANVNTGNKFETYGNIPNVYYFSGYSAATISFLTGNVTNAVDIFNEAMNQELLSYIN